MTAKIATEKGFLLQRKTKPYPLFAIDGQISSNGGMVTHETIPLEMIMLRGHKEEIQFDIVDMNSHAYILGMPWLKKHNP